MGERQRSARAEEMATTSTAVATVSPQVQEEVERVAVITLRPTAPADKKEARKKVVWTEDTVDNEHMNKKKSKCCCIYEKPRRFDESDSEESEDECEHCFGHVEMKHQHSHQRQEANTTVETEETVQEPTATISLQPEAPAPAPPDEAPPAS